MPAPRRDTRPNRQPTEPAWLADEVLDRKFAEFMKSWDDEPGQDAHQARHRRERTRMERISARIGAGLGAIATVAAVAYAGLELYSRVRGR
jgi:biopolymer transport protein ExbB/TolQ